MLPVCHLNASSTCGVTGKSQRCALEQGYLLRFVLGAENLFSVKSSQALSIRYDAVSKVFCLFWLKLMICQTKHQILLFP